MGQVGNPLLPTVITALHVSGPTLGHRPNGQLQPSALPQHLLPTVPQTLRSYFPFCDTPPLAEGEAEVLPGHGLEPGALALLPILICHLLSRELGQMQEARAHHLGLATHSLPATGAADPSPLPGDHTPLTWRGTVCATRFHLVCRLLHPCLGSDGVSGHPTQLAHGP